jgi:hypothetical protein
LPWLWWNLEERNLNLKVNLILFINSSAIKILKLKLQEYFNLGRPEVTLPDYALH